MQQHEDIVRREMFLRIIEAHEKAKRRRILRRKILVYVIGTVIMAVGIMISWYACNLRSQATEKPITVLSELETVHMAGGVEIPLSKMGTEFSETPTHSFDWDCEESYLLAKIAMAEAESEDIVGKALVILTVLNRVHSNLDYFPDSIEEVIFQEGEFTPIADGRFDRVEPNEDCYKALELIEKGWDKSRGALYFERTTDESTWHSRNLEKLFDHGNHTFYKEVE